MRFEPLAKLMSENTKNGIYKSKDFMGAGTPIVKMSQQFGNRFIDSCLDGYEQIILGDKELEGYRLLENDLLFSRTSVVPEGVGMCSIIREKERDLVFESNIIRVRLNSDLVNPEFVFRYFQSPQGRGSVLSIAGGTNIKTIKASSLKDLKVPLFDRDAQNNVVEMLRNYDDLIENNRRRIQLLEESARLLYQEWFVHLRFPGHEQVKINDGVPEGWEKKPLTTIAEVNQASLKKGFNERIEYIDISCVSTHSISDTTWYEFAEAPGRARRIVKHCDILWSCVRPNRRSHVLVWEPHDRLIASTGFAVISATQVSPFFLYQSLTTNDYVGYLTNRAGGAAYPAVTAKVFEESLVLVPSCKLVELYDDQVKNTYKKINVLRSQNVKLAQARDLLLPKLMSGELTV